MWAARNRVPFKGDIVNIRSIVLSIKYTAWGWFIARKDSKTGVSESNWLNCPMGFLLSV